MPPQPILLVVQSLGHGGCERDAAKLALGLDRARFAPHVAVLRTGGFRAAEVRDAGVPIVDLQVNSFLTRSVFSAARRLGNYAHEHGITLVHSFDVPTDIFSALSVRIGRIPHLITAQLSFRTLVSFRERLLLRVSDRLSDFVVVNSQAVGDSLRDEYKVTRDKIYLCYNGVDSREFYPAPVQRPDYLHDASVVVGSVCVMRPEKRIDWLIRSFAEARAIDPMARLLLVGSGPEVTRLHQLSESLGLASVCFFEPGRPDVADWMRMMDVYVNASVSESFPNGLLEAMACGCCAIGSKVGGIPELISHLHSGLTFDPDQQGALTASLRMVLRDSQLRQSLRENGFGIAHGRFSMHNTIERMQSLYDRLLQT